MQIELSVLRGAFHIEAAPSFFNFLRSTGRTPADPSELKLELCIIGEFVSSAPNEFRLTTLAVCRDMTGGSGFFRLKKKQHEGDFFGLRIPKAYV
jgi:hypothetical protein